MHFTDEFSYQCQKLATASLAMARHLTLERLRTRLLEASGTSSLLPCRTAWIEPEPAMVVSSEWPCEQSLAA